MFKFYEYCFNKYATFDSGDNRTVTVNDLQVVTFRGTGIPEECLRYMDEIIYEAADEDHCLPKPCAIGKGNPFIETNSVSDVLPFSALTFFKIKYNILEESTIYVALNIFYEISVCNEFYSIFF